MKIRLIYLISLICLIFSSFSYGSSRKNFEQSIKRNAYDFTYGLCVDYGALSGLSLVLTKESFSSGFMLSSDDVESQSDFSAYLKDIFVINPMLAHLFMSDGFYRALTDCFGSDFKSRESFIYKLFGSDFIGRVGGVLLSVCSFNIIKLGLIKLFPKYGARFIKYLERFIIITGTIGASALAYTFHKKQKDAKLSSNGLIKVFDESLKLDKKVVKKIPTLMTRIYINNIINNNKDELRFKLEAQIDKEKIHELPHNILNDLCKIQTYFNDFLVDHDLCLKL